MKREKVLIFKTTDEERRVIEEKTRKFKFGSMSEYVRFVILNCETIEVKVQRP
jgi:phosphoenolpyruvate synthase/pyruvate phosphate dikinase